MATTLPKILLRDGILLVHDDKARVVPRRADLLIKEQIITRIDENIEITGTDVTIIDCSDKIISPGFINTHQHVWQTQTKGRHGNHTLLQYLPSGNFIGVLYTIEDAFWGELSGAMEAINGGTTTIVDHSNINLSPHYAPTMIQALDTSGLRAVYCPCVPRSIAKSEVFGVTDDYSPSSALTHWKTIAELAPFADGRVQLGFAIDNLRLPASQIQELYSELRDSKAKLITSHGPAGKAFSNTPSAIQLLNDHGLLGPDILISHANHPKDDDAELLANHGAFVSSTPNVELQMGSPPIALMPEFEPYASIGVDCHSFGVSFMPAQMRLLLQHARTERVSAMTAKGNWSRSVRPKVEQVFNLATIGGARAIGMAGEVGQIKVGAKADLSIFDMTTPTMLAASHEDPVAAVVLHSSEADVIIVIVDGVIRKYNGKLLPVKVADAVGNRGLDFNRKMLTWKDVAERLLKSREQINQRSTAIDYRAVENHLIDAWHMDRESLVDED